VSSDSVYNNTRDCSSLYDYRPNSTLLGLITITYLKLLNKGDGRTGKIGLDGVDRA